MLAIVPAVTPGIWTWSSGVPGGTSTLTVFVVPSTM
jgi:hypothetical protein